MPPAPRWLVPPTIPLQPAASLLQWMLLQWMSVGPLNHFNASYSNGCHFKVQWMLCHWNHFNASCSNGCCFNGWVLGHWITLMQVTPMDVTSKFNGCHFKVQWMLCHWNHFNESCSNGCCAIEITSVKVAPMDVTVLQWNLRHCRNNSFNTENSLILGRKLAINLPKLSKWQGPKHELRSLYLEHTHTCTHTLTHPNTKQQDYGDSA